MQMGHHNQLSLHSRIAHDVSQQLQDPISLHRMTLLDKLQTQTTNGGSNTDITELKRSAFRPYLL